MQSELSARQDREERQVWGEQISREEQGCRSGEAGLRAQPRSARFAITVPGSTAATTPGGSPRPGPGLLPAPLLLAPMRDPAALLVG